MLLKSEEKRKADDKSVVRKSAFDILEDFVNRDEIVKQNFNAIKSETLMNVVESKVVDISSDEVFNAPEIDSEFEALRAQEMADLDAEEVAQNLEAEGLELEKALDFAFEQLTGEKLEEGEMEFEVDGEINNLDMSIDDAITLGKDFDLDLAFLNEVPEEKNEIE
jgi:hypothetical protein